jgi:tRNA(Glu) U13 pseudouridine synthase TruD
MLNQQTVGEREGGKKTGAPAMELSFSLETNCFATIFLREVMKQ